MSLWPKKKQRPPRTTPAALLVPANAAAAALAVPANAAAAALGMPGNAGAAALAVPANAAADALGVLVNAAAAALPVQANAAAGALAAPETVVAAALATPAPTAPTAIVVGAATPAVAAATGVLAWLNQSQSTMTRAAPAVSTGARSVRGTVDQPKGQDGEASARGMQMMALTRFLAGAWSAHDVTTMAWHVAQMGYGHVWLPGLARQPNPRDPFHNASRHVERALRFAEEDAKWYIARIPMQDANIGHRVLKDTPFFLPHMLVDELGPGAPETPHLDTPAFLQHPVTQKHGARTTVALGLFADGTEYTTDDSITVFYANLNGGAQRHCLAAVEKGALCQCGCKGSCTLLAVARVLAWSLEAAAAGRHPEERHDGSAFPRGPWQDRAGKPLQKNGALTHIRLDLLAVWEYFGFHRWNNPEHPCYECHCARADLHNYGRHNSWGEVTRADYLNRVASTTFVVRVPIEAINDVLAALSASWNPKANGRVLRAPFPQYGLSAGDCLTVGGDVLDLWEFETELRARASSKNHAVLVFARIRQAPFKFTNPLMFVTGVSPSTIAVDRMHSLDLGTVSAWNATVIWRLLEAAVGQTQQNRGLRARAYALCILLNMQAGCLGHDGLPVLSRLIKRWKPFRRAGGRGPPTRKTWIRRIQLRNIGPQNKPFMKFRSGGASKARLVLRFLAVFLTRHYETLEEAGLRGNALLRAGLLLRRVYHFLLLAEKRALADAECTSLVRAMVGAMKEMKKAGIHQYPKAHMCVHLAKQAPCAASVAAA